MKREYKHGGSTFKNIVLLLKTVIAAAGFGLIWLGLAYTDCSFAPAAVICGSIIAFLSLIFQILIPISNILNKR